MPRMTPRTYFLALTATEAATLRYLLSTGVMSEMPRRGVGNAGRILARLKSSTVESNTVRYKENKTMEYTKGPWVMNDAGLIFGQVSGDHDEAPFVADVCETSKGTSVSKQETANGRLIAAAPDLLLALVNLALVCPPEFDRTVYAAALDAIESATGRSPGHVLADAMMVRS